MSCIIKLKNPALMRFPSLVINYNNGAVDMQICALLTRIQCKVSDTQVTVKACGPLVLNVYGKVSRGTYRRVYTACKKS